MTYMNAFIPYPNFQASVACYTDTILINVIQSIFVAWDQIRKKHYCELDYYSYYTWKLWHNWEQAFIYFGLICLNEADKRNLEYDKKEAEFLSSVKINRRWDRPFWLGWEEFHSSQRGLLLHHGECEKLAARILHSCNALPNSNKDAQLCNQGSIVKQWLEQQDFSNCVFTLTNLDLQYAHSILNRQGYAPAFDKNPYEHLNWTEKPLHNNLIDILEPEESKLL